MKPNFLILGAQKSGTTSLYHYLNQHPDVYMSEPKEPHYFERKDEYTRGADFYWHKYFKGWNNQRAIGDGNPNNLYFPYVPQLIQHVLPEAKLIMILRNPVDRAYSDWWMNYSSGEERLPFERAFRETPDYLDRGYYSRQINRYLALFPKSQVKIVFFEDLVDDPQSLARELWDFVEVDPSLCLKATRPRNVSWNSKRVASLIGIILRLRLQRIAPEILRIYVRAFLSNFGDRPTMDSGIRSHLLEHYCRYNRELETIVARDLSGWDT